MRGQGNGSQISHRSSSVTPTALPTIACLRWERAMVWWRLRRGRGDGRGGGRGAAAAVPTPTAFVLFFLGPPASFDETCSQCTAIVFAKHDYRVCNARLSCSQCTAIVFAMLRYRCLATTCTCAPACGSRSRLDAASSASYRCPGPSQLRACAYVAMVGDRGARREGGGE